MIVSTFVLSYSILLVTFYTNIFFSTGFDSNSEMSGKIDPTKRNEALGVDLFSAIVAACAVAPGITIVDKGKNI